MATKFDRLTSEELALLEDSFVQFLVVQGIDASSWVRIKEEQPEKMNQLLDQFSDYVHYSTLISCQFISKSKDNIVITSQLSKNKISTFELTLSDADLTKINSEKDLFTLLEEGELDLSHLSFQSSSIEGDREECIYKLLKTEYFKIDKGHLYKRLALIQAEK